jgi:HEAT repeat protein
MHAFQTVMEGTRLLLNSPEAARRREAALALGKLEDKAAIGPLRQAMHDHDDLVKWHAACALARLGDFQVMMCFLGEERSPFLPGMQLLKLDPWVWVKAAGRDACEDVLAELVEPLNFIFLRKGADFLIQHQEHRLVPVLWDLLDHEDYRIRAVAAHKLGALPDAGSAERLIPLLHDGVEVVADRAADALKMLGSLALEVLKKNREPGGRIRELIQSIEVAGG